MLDCLSEMFFLYNCTWLALCHFFFLNSSLARMAGVIRKTSWAVSNGSGLPPTSGRPFLPCPTFLSPLCRTASVAFSPLSVSLAPPHKLDVSSSTGSTLTSRYWKVLSQSRSERDREFSGATDLEGLKACLGCWWTCPGKYQIQMEAFMPEIQGPHGGFA